MSTIQVGVRLPESLHEKLIEYAKKNNISKTHVIILALANHLKVSEDLSLEQKFYNLENELINLKNTVNNLVDNSKNQ